MRGGQQGGGTCCTTPARRKRSTSFARSLAILGQYDAMRREMWERHAQLADRHKDSNDPAQRERLRAAMEALVEGHLDRPQPDNGGDGDDGFLDGLLDALGKVWNFVPNTAIGLVYTVAGVFVDIVNGDGIAIRLRIANNALEVLNHPLFDPNGLGLTLGNTIHYPNDPTEDTRRHERLHTIQYQILGPFLLPLYGLGALLTRLRGFNPIGPEHPLEDGPHNHGSVAALNQLGRDQ